MTALHPRSSADPRMLRWITATALPAELPALDGLVADGVLERAEIGAGEIRTWLAEGAAGTTPGRWSGPPCSRRCARCPNAPNSPRISSPNASPS